MAISWISRLSSNQSALNKSHKQKQKWFILIVSFSIWLIDILCDIEQGNAFLFWWKENKNYTYSLNVATKGIILSQQCSELPKQIVLATKKKQSYIVFRLLNTQSNE